MWLHFSVDHLSLFPSFGKHRLWCSRDGSECEYSRINTLPDELDSTRILRERNEIESGSYVGQVLSS